jgi:hypothetical protein
MCWSTAPHWAASPLPSPRATPSVAAATLPASVTIVEPLHRVGGMLAGGMVDDSNAGNTRAYDGIAAELYRRVARHYRASDPATACFKGEPGVVEGVMREWLTQENITLRLGEAIEHLQLKSGGLIASATLTSGLRVTAPQWIDASYEGDLLALAEVPVLFGRESSARWNESLAGQGLCSNAVRNDAVFTPTYETFTVPENATDAAGRLLAGVDGEYSTWDEAAGLLRSDTRVQSYNFRACLRKLSPAPGRAVPIVKPAGYNVGDYELFARHIAALRLHNPNQTISLGSEFVGGDAYTGGKFDTNDGHALGLNPMGNETYHWALATPAERVALRQRFVNYTLGLFWFLGSDPRVPESVRQGMKTYALCADEWAEPGEQHLPHIPYIREARRMNGGDFIFTQEDYRRRIGDDKLPIGKSGIIDDGGTDPARSVAAVNFSVGLGFWFIDCHATRRTSVGGLLQNEGCIQYGRKLMDKNSVFEIPFGVMLPPVGSVRNLLSVCAMSASHVGFQAFRVVSKSGLVEPFINENEHFTKTGSGQTQGKLKKKTVFPQEPTYMVLGQASARQIVFPFPIVRLHTQYALCV